MPEIESVKCIDVSVIIVNYNTKEITLDCLRSVYEQTKDVEFEVIISDNGSTDGSIEAIKKEFPEVHIINNGENLGFGKANNRGLKMASGKYIFYLNSDTILLNNAVKIFADYWKKNSADKNLGCIGTRLVNRQGEPILSWGEYPTPVKILVSLLHMLFAPNIHRRKTINETIPPEEEIVNGYISGADLFLLNDENAYFDERYFMYAEEMDLEYNHFYLKKRECVLLSEPRIIHLTGASDNSGNGSGYDFGKTSTILLWMSNIKYLRKNYPKSKLYVWLIKKILFHIWKKKKYIGCTKMYFAQLRAI